MAGFTNCLNCDELRKKLETLEKKLRIKRDLIELYKNFYDSTDVTKLKYTSSDVEKIYTTAQFDIYNLGNRLKFLTGENQQHLKIQDNYRSQIAELERNLKSTERNLEHVSFVNKQVLDYHTSIEKEQSQLKGLLKRVADSLLKFEAKNSDAKKALAILATSKENISSLLSEYEPYKKPEGSELVEKEAATQDKLTHLSNKQISVPSPQLSPVPSLISELEKETPTKDKLTDLNNKSPQLSPAPSLTSEDSTFSQEDSVDTFLAHVSLRSDSAANKSTADKVPSITQNQDISSDPSSKGELPATLSDFTSDDGLLENESLVGAMETLGHFNDNSQMNSFNYDSIFDSITDNDKRGFDRNSNQTSVETKENVKKPCETHRSKCTIDKSVLAETSLTATSVNTEKITINVNNNDNNRKEVDNLKCKMSNSPSIERNARCSPSSNSDKCKSPCEGIFFGQRNCSQNVLPRNNPVPSNIQFRASGYEDSCYDFSNRAPCSERASFVWTFKDQSSLHISLPVNKEQESIGIDINSTGNPAYGFSTENDAIANKYSIVINLKPDKVKTNLSKSETIVSSPKLVKPNDFRKAATCGGNENDIPRHKFGQFPLGHQRDINDEKERNAWSKPCSPSFVQQLTKSSHPDSIALQMKKLESPSNTVSAPINHLNSNCNVDNHSSVESVDVRSIHESKMNNAPNSIFQNERSVQIPNNNNESLALGPISPYNQITKHNSNPISTYHDGATGNNSGRSLYVSPENIGNRFENKSSPYDRNQCGNPELLSFCRMKSPDFDNNHSTDILHNKEKSIVLETSINDSPTCLENNSNSNKNPNERKVSSVDYSVTCESSSTSVQKNIKRKRDAEEGNGINENLTSGPSLSESELQYSPAIKTRVSHLNSSISLPIAENGNLKKSYCENNYSGTGTQSKNKVLNKKKIITKEGTKSLTNSARSTLYLDSELEKVFKNTLSKLVPLSPINRSPVHLDDIQDGTCDNNITSELVDEGNCKSINHELKGDKKEKEMNESLQDGVGTKDIIDHQVEVVECVQKSKETSPFNDTLCDGSKKTDNYKVQKFPCSKNIDSSNFEEFSLPSEDIKIKKTSHEQLKPSDCSVSNNLLSNKVSSGANLDGASIASSKSQKSPTFKNSSGHKIAKSTIRKFYDRCNNQMAGKDSSLKMHKAFEESFGTKSLNPEKAERTNESESNSIANNETSLVELNKNSLKLEDHFLHDAVLVNQSPLEAANVLQTSTDGVDETSDDKRKEDVIQKDNSSFFPPTNEKSIIDINETAIPDTEAIEGRLTETPGQDVINETVEFVNRNITVDKQINIAKNKYHELFGDMEDFEEVTGFETGSGISLEDSATESSTDSVSEKSEYERKKDSVKDNSSCFPPEEYTIFSDIDFSKGIYSEASENDQDLKTKNNDYSESPSLKKNLKMYPAKRKSLPIQVTKEEKTNNHFSSHSLVKRLSVYSSPHASYKQTFYSSDDRVDNSDDMLSLANGNSPNVTLDIQSGTFDPTIFRTSDGNVNTSKTMNNSNGLNDSSCAAYDKESTVTKVPSFRGFYKEIPLNKCDVLNVEDASNEETDEFDVKDTSSCMSSLVAASPIKESRTDKRKHEEHLEGSNIPKKFRAEEEPFENCEMNEDIEKEVFECKENVFITSLKFFVEETLAEEKEEEIEEPNIKDDIKHSPDVNKIKEELKRLIGINEEDTYIVVNKLAGKLQQSTFIQPRPFARAVIEMISQDNGKEIKDFPKMTRFTKLCLLLTISYIGYNCEFLMELLGCLEENLCAYYDKTLLLPQGIKLITYYAALCRSYNLKSKGRQIIYDVMYARHVKAYPMIAKVLHIWPDILPKSATCLTQDCPLTQVIVKLLIEGPKNMSNSKSEKLFGSHALRIHMRNFYGYTFDQFRTDDLCNKMLNRITERSSQLGLVLLAHCEGLEWAMNVIERKVYPMLHLWLEGKLTHSIAKSAILCTGMIVRAFPLTKCSYFAKNTLELFEQILHKSPDSSFSETVVESISYLRRHNLMLCALILIKWAPSNGTITKKTLQFVRNILSAKNITHWKTFYYQYHK